MNGTVTRISYDKVQLEGFRNVGDALKCLYEMDLPEYYDVVLKENGDLPDVLFYVSPKCKIKVLDMFDSGVTKIEWIHYFKNGDSLRKVILPSGLKELPPESFGGAFDSCKNLEEVVLPEGLIVIEDRAFQNCSSLRSITIPKSVRYIGRDVFFGCENLREVRISKELYKILNEENRIYRGNLAAITIYDDDTGEFSNVNNKNRFKKFDNRHLYESQYAVFDKNTRILRIRDGMESLECNLIFDVFIEDEECKVDWYDDLEVIVPNSMKRIGRNSFNSWNISEITIPDTVEEIEEQGFSCCDLDHLIWPMNTKVIKTYTFSSCGRLKWLNLPEGLLEIGDYAFSGCKDLTSIVIPSTVKKIGKEVFSGCFNLRKIFVPKSLQSEFTDKDALVTFWCYYIEGRVTPAEIIYYDDINSIVNSVDASEDTYHVLESIPRENTTI